MKKLIVVLLIAVLCLSISSAAFAGKKIGYGTAPDFTSTMIGLSLYAPSQGVQVFISTCTNNQSYCGSSQHSSSLPTNNGKQYYTSSADPAMRDKDAVIDGPTACVCQ